MKIKLIVLLILSSLYGDLFDYNKSKSCSDIMNEIDLLKKEKVNNTSTKVATFIFGGGYLYGISNKEIGMKIRVLKLELSQCK